MLKKILFTFFGWRVLLFFIAFIGSLILPFQPRFPYWETLLTPSGFPPYIWSFANFDGVHYITIADKGYAAQFTQVFFPLYPLMVRTITWIFRLPIIASGLLVANLAGIIFIWLFIRLLAYDYKVKSICWTLVFLLAFPTSFFFGSLYTESLFMTFVIGCFLAARQKIWWLVAILGALATATRFVGIFLLPAMLIELWSEEKITVKPVLSIAIIPLGLLSYMWYLARSFGDPLYFWHAQPVFGAERSGTILVTPLQVIFRYLKILTTVYWQQYDFWVAAWELGSFMLGLTLLILAHKKKVRLSYLVFSWLAILTPALTGTLSSMPRYLLTAFPIFISLALIKKRLIKLTILMVSSILLFVFTILFTRGLWVS